MRIVSLLPSATEIICGIGLRDQLVGVTHECDFPSSVRELPRVTRTLIPADATSIEIDGLVRERLKTEEALYSLERQTLHDLQPDLIVTQSLCDVCAVAKSEVAAAVCSLPGSPRVVNLEPTCLDDVLDCMRQVGIAANVEPQAVHFLSHLQDRVDRVAACSEVISDSNRPLTLLLEWIDPPFSAGHWSPELIKIAGGREAIGVAGQRSVTTPWEQIVDVNPEIMVIACCGFDVARTTADLPILKAYPGWESLACVRNDRVYIVDGSAYFNRPGPRLVDSLELVAHLLHPSLHPAPRDMSGHAKVGGLVP